MENKISVIVPVYKVENYLPRCIDSILNQTYKNLEIILINDGSPDSSGRICDEYANKDNRIIVIHKKNEGSSCARNAGLDIATGHYISFVDSDDYIKSSMLELMLSRMLEFNLDIVESKTKSKDSKSSSDLSFEVQDKITAIKNVIQNSAFSVWRRLYKSSLVYDLRFIPKIIHQDVFYTIDVLNRINKMGYLNCKLYNYNTDNQSVIRSDYSLEKITIGVLATEYLINNVPKHAEVQQAVNDYITYYYTDHYFLLSRNTHIDPNKLFRKKLRDTIKKSLSFRNFGFRSILVVILPYKFMELISSSYNSINS